MNISLIVATDLNGGIGHLNALPNWDLPSDLKRFRSLTRGHVCIVGSRTLESIQNFPRPGLDPYNPLPGRILVRVSHDNATSSNSIVCCGNVATALSCAVAIEQFAGRDEVFVIGGASVYTAVLAHVTRVYLTRVHIEAECDTYMSAGWLDAFTLIDGPHQSADNQTVFDFETYERRA